MEQAGNLGLGFLFAAFFVTWLVLLLYLIVLSGRLSALKREVEALRRNADVAHDESPKEGSRPLSS